MVGAVVIIAASETVNGGLSPAAMRLEQRSLPCIELLGRSVLGRTVEELLRARVDAVAVVASAPFASAVMGNDNVAVHVAQDVWTTAAERAAAFKAEAVLVVRLGPYVEFDAADLLQFHRDRGMLVTRGCTDESCLDLWVMSPEFIQEGEIRSRLHSKDVGRYFVSGYVNRLESPRDLRQLIADGFAGRCQFRPQGVEIRPGIWIGQGAEVERTARLVAPVFIGRDSKIADQCLVTRGSNVESNSQVDYGTVIEDSTVLSNTYVGIGLDLSHSIVEGENLLHVQHGVKVKIADPVVLRPMRGSRVRSGVDGSFLANLELGNVAMSSVPKKEQ